MTRSKTDLGWDLSNCASYRSHDNPSQHRDRITSGHDQYWTPLVLGFGPPDLPLRGHLTHQGSSAIIPTVA